ncbi:MAG: release factor glutamine methyltransferase [Candidatus Deianiraeaceae bacterium]
MIHTLTKQFPNINAKVLVKLILYALNMRDISQVILMQRKLTNKELQTLQSCVEECQAGKPLEYILQSCDFYGMEFFINENVLIPRIETEALVDEAINSIKKKSCKVLDLCTGSGSIAIAIAKNCPSAEVIGVDISHNALLVCNANIKKYKLENRVQILQMDILQKIPHGDFDIITANPPYIETEVIPTLENSVRNFEPHIALDGGIDGLVFYKQLKQYALLVKKCIFLFEIGYNQKKSVCDIFAEFNPQIIQDFNGNDRIIKFTT